MNHLASIPASEVVDSVPESHWESPEFVPKVSKARRTAFTGLLECVFCRLPPDQRSALPAFIFCDWKAHDVFEWRARRLAPAHGCAAGGSSSGQGIASDLRPRVESLLRKLRMPLHAHGGASEPSAAVRPGGEAAHRPPAQP